ncbi:hypothetical protein MMC32_001364 [Xylographa parallela]|nr:hypothetical protein [Xylographa parallela]
MGLDLDRLIAVVNGKEVEVEGSSRWATFSRYISGQFSFDVRIVAYTHASKSSNIFKVMEESQQEKINRLYSQAPQPQNPADPGTTQGPGQFSQDLGREINSLDPKRLQKRAGSMTKERPLDHSSQSVWRALSLGLNSQQTSKSDHRRLDH